MRNEIEFKESAIRICDLYKKAKEMHKNGIHLVSTDEKTGMQALERKYQTHPGRPGKIELREFEYIRHGTLCLTGNFEIATGEIISPTIGLTRTEYDFVNHIKNTVATDPDAQWIFVCDNLNTHMSESLVMWVATKCGISTDLGKKGKSGILKNKKSRQDFLINKNHQIRFAFTPKHASWLNQIEIWFSTLSNRLLNRGNFKSIGQLERRILKFIEFFNQSMAKPYKWTYSGKPLIA